MRKWFLLWAVVAPALRVRLWCHLRPKVSRSGLHVYGGIAFDAAYGPAARNGGIFSITSVVTHGTFCANGGISEITSKDAQGSFSSKGGICV